MRETQVLGVAGSAALWTAFGILVTSSVVFYILLLFQPVGRRIFHVYTFTITATASVCYLLMSVQQGYKIVGVRPVYWIRYVDWLVTTPLILLDLGTLISIDHDNIVLLIFLDLLMILSGAVGSFVGNWQNLFFWGAGMLFYILIVFEVFSAIRFLSNRISVKVKNLYLLLATSTVSVWSMYPIVWLLADGLNIMPVDLETILYALLDISAKCAFGFVLLLSREAVADATADENAVSTEEPLLLPTEAATPEA
uniref:H 2-mkate-hbetabr n=1 Tax=Tetraselmis sp. GSL018 TaxID=582737 RepID=A0A061RSZ0_9CHLO